MAAPFLEALEPATTSAIYNMHVARSVAPPASAATRTAIPLWQCPNPIV